MLFDTNRRIALRCGDCSNYRVANFNLFKLKSSLELTCICGQKMLKAHINSGEVTLLIKCVACDDIHTFNFCLKEMVERPITILSCPKTGIELGFIGEKDNIDRIITRYSDDMSELLCYLNDSKDRGTRIVK